MEGRGRRREWRSQKSASALLDKWIGWEGDLRLGLECENLMTE